MASPQRNLTGLAVITTVMVMVLSGLGIWQLERLAAKAAILKRIDQRIAAPPVSLPPQAQWQERDLDYLKVTVTGTFRHDQESYLFGVIDKNERGDNVPGYFILTPLAIETGATLIVNRGFVPQDKKSPNLRAEGLVQGSVTVTGLVRMAERTSFFTPDADPKSRVLYARDPALVARWSNLQNVAPFILDADATPISGGLPSGGHTIVSVPNNHLQYALTWFALAGITVAMFVLYAVKRRHDEPE